MPPSVNSSPIFNAFQEPLFFFRIQLSFSTCTWASPGYSLFGNKATGSSLDSLIESYFRLFSLALQCCNSFLE